MHLHFYIRQGQELSCMTSVLHVWVFGEEGLGRKDFAKYDIMPREIRLIQILFINTLTRGLYTVGERWIKHTKKLSPDNLTFSMPFLYHFERFDLTD